MYKKCKKVDIIEGCYKKVKAVFFGSESVRLDKLVAVLQSAYGNAGYPRYSFEKVEEFQLALELFKSAHPDLMFLDKNHPEALKLCQVVRSAEDSRHTGIIFYGDHFSPISTVEALDAGGDDVIDPQVSDAEVLARANASYRLKHLTDKLRSANHRLRVLSLIDDLTGLFNMRAFFEKYAQLMRECANQGVGVAVCMMDLDHFKSVNDGSNHLVGSYVLSEVGRLIRLSKVFGEEAILARYGGDEFIVAATYSGASEAKKAAESFRCLIKGAEFVKGEYKIALTCSIGVGFAEPGYSEDINELIKLADLMLYRSKEAGRDRVSVKLASNEALDKLPSNSRICQELEQVPVALAKKLKGI